MAVNAHIEVAPMSMLSSLARSPMGKELLQFADDNDLPADWEDPMRYGVTAFCSGRTFDNRVGAVSVVDGRANEELLVHLESHRGRCAINLNTIMALACAHIRAEYEAAEVLVAKADAETP